MLSSSTADGRSGSSIRPASRLFAVTLLAVGLACSACSSDQPGAPAPAATVPADWGTITDEDTGFSFRAPGDVDRLNQRVQLPDGTASELTVYTHVDRDLELAVSFLPLDPDSFDLESAAVGAAEAVAGELVSVRPVDVAGRRGRHVEVSARREGRGLLILQRIFLTDEALVQLQVSGPADSRTELELLHQQLLAGVG